MLDVVLPVNLQDCDSFSGLNFELVPIVGNSIGIAGGLPSFSQDLSPERKIVCSGIPGIMGPLTFTVYRL
jgi:hypothetical protein